MEEEETTKKSSFVFDPTGVSHRASDRKVYVLQIRVSAGEVRLHATNFDLRLSLMQTLFLFSLWYI